jgi:hypothetical protein
MDGLRRPVVTVGLAAATVVLVAVVATGGRVPLATEGSGGWHLDGRGGTIERRSVDDLERVRTELPSNSRLPGEGALEVLAQLGVILIGATALFLIGRALLRVRRRIAEEMAAQPEEHWPQPAHQMVEAVDEGLTALAAGPVDEVIVACWVRLEDAAEAAGAGRRPTETSAELAARVLDELHAPATAVTGLLHRYRQARYSHHPLGEDDRAVAIRSLEEIRAAIAGAPA